MPCLQSMRRRELGHFNTWRSGLKVSEIHEVSRKARNA